MKFNETGNESRLILKKLFFENISFERASEIGDNTALDISMNKTIEELTDSCYKVTVALEIADETEAALSIKLTAVGDFELADFESLDEEFKQDVINKNTLSIMFPYIRSQVSLITTQPDLNPIVLPALNINAMLEKPD